MSHYPPAAHVLSLFIGWFTGSTLSGIFFVTAVSFILVYVVVAEFMRHESLTDTFVAYLAFILMALVCRSGRFLEGNEIVANFFFAQFAGTAGLLAGFSILSRLKSQPFLIWLPAAAVATHFVGWIYTVNAIELALSCVMLQFLEFLHVRSRQSAARVFISAVILGAASVVHPTIIGAIGIAGNDGGISISATTSMISFVSLLIGTLALTISPLRSKLIHLDAVIALSWCACSVLAASRCAGSFQDRISVCDQEVWLFDGHDEHSDFCLSREPARTRSSAGIRPPPTRSCPDREHGVVRNCIALNDHRFQGENAGP